MIRTRFAAIAVLLLAAAARAEDQYFSIPLSEVVPAEKLPAAASSPAPPAPAAEEFRHWSTSRAELLPRIVLSTANSEAYVRTEPILARYWTTAELLKAARVMLRIPAGTAAPYAGTIFIPDGSLTSQVAIPFTYLPPATPPPVGAKTDFLQAKQLCYFNLAEAQLPGGAWFRHQERAAAEALGKNKLDLTHSRYLNAELDTSDFDLLAGRKLAENFDLDRAVARLNDPRTVDIATLESIPARQVAGSGVRDPGSGFDWKPLVKDLHPDLDPLAALIPADQHAMFFPNLAAFSAFLAEADRDLNPLRGIASRKNVEDPHILERYSRQLCLPLADLDKNLPPGLVNSVVLTGSDPCLALGTGVAILIEPKGDSAWDLLQSIKTEIDRQNEVGVVRIPAGQKPVRIVIPDPEVKITEIPQDDQLPAHSSYLSADRRVSAYVGIVGKAVVITNSRQQFRVLADVESRKTNSLASLDQYRYARSRYPRSDKNESALLFISESSIRRWCSAKVRIASAYRLRAAAILAEMETASVENPAGDDGPVDLPAEFKLDRHHDLGSLSRFNDRIKSETYNTLQFLAPAEELELSKVSAADAESYKRWRDRFQTNYRRYFDPVACRFSITKEQVAADLTMMPLPANSFYQLVLGTYFKGRFAGDAGDPHQDWFHFVVGIDASNPPWSEIIPKFVPLPGSDKGMNPLKWLGNNAAIYIEDDPFWQEASKLDLKGKEAEEFLLKNASRIPIAARVASKNPFGEAAFVIAASAYLENPPGAVKFTNLTYHDQPYVKIEPAKAEQEGWKKFTWYYLATPEALVVTLNEGLLKRAIDRRVAAATQPAATREENQKSEIKNQKWLGQTLAGHVDGNLLRLAIGLNAPKQVQRLQEQSWAAIPALNDLRRLHPEGDAVELYRKMFCEVPTDPLGGVYAWDEKVGSYASSTLGCPVSPKSPSPIAPILGTLREVEVGLTMEESGMRVRVRVGR